MEKKYTKKEIEEMFMKAQSKAMCNLSERFNELADERSDGESHEMQKMIFSMQNMMAIAEVYSEMIKEME